MPMPPNPTLNCLPLSEAPNRLARRRVSKSNSVSVITNGYDRSINSDMGPVRFRGYIRWGVGV